MSNTIGTGSRPGAAHTASQPGKLRDVEQAKPDVEQAKPSGEKANGTPKFNQGSVANGSAKFNSLG